MRERTGSASMPSSPASRAASATGSTPDRAAATRSASTGWSWSSGGIANSVYPYDRTEIRNCQGPGHLPRRPGHNPGGHCPGDGSTRPQAGRRSWSPAPGYATDGYSRGPAGSAWVRFKSSGTELTVAVTCTGGRPHFTTAADNGGGGGDEHGGGGGPGPSRGGPGPSRGGSAG